MKKLLYITTILLGFTIQAQKKYSEKITLSGKVIEATTKQPLEYATFVITNLKTKRVTGGITNSNGSFTTSIPKGKYNIAIEFIGFKTKNLFQKELVKNTNLSTILLYEDAETLDEIEIIAEKSTVEIRLDKKIFNVGKDMTLKGGNASDVLDNVPSVNVDAEGAISLRGNENVRVLIDGKPSALVGLNGTDALKNLPADAIEKVEVITSPSARYDAEGTAGILNIILRKGKVTGFNGSLGITVGNPDQINIAPNINYRTKKINIFTNLGYSYKNGPGSADYKTTSLDENFNETFFTYQDRDYTRKNNNYNASFGLEYYINKKSSVTGTFVYQNSKKNIYSENIVTSGTDKNTLTLDTTRDLFEDEFDNTKQYSLNYTNNINDKGHKLTADLQYSESSEEELSEIFDDGIFTSNNDEFTKSKNYLLQIDYVLPLKGKSQLELGHKADVENLSSSFETTDNNNQFVKQVLNFDQTIYAYYAQYGNKLNKLSFLLGLRAETTKVDFDLEGTNSNASIKDYTELFPTLNLGFEINEDDNITLGYNRRLRRPKSRFLNPFPSQSSSTFIFMGNPDLDPTFTNAIELGYNSKIKKLNFGTSVYYQNSVNPIYVSSRTIANGTIEVRQPINLDAESRYGLEITTNYKPTKWLRLSASFNFFNYKTESFNFTYLDENNIEQTTFLEEVESSNWFSRFNASVTLPWDIQWQTRLSYRGLQRTAQTDRLPRFNTNLAFSKDILKEKGTLTLNVKDLFNSRRLQLTTYNNDRVAPESITELDFQRRVRQINLTFIYRFNQQKKKGKKSNKNGNGNDEGGF